MLSGAFRTLGRAYIDLAAGIFSANVLLHIGFRDWCGEVVCSRAFNKRTPFSVTLARSKSGSRQTDDGVCCICNLKALTLQLDACQVLLHEVIP